jgi:hypothetical protein
VRSRERRWADRVAITLGAVVGSGLTAKSHDPWMVFGVLVLFLVVACFVWLSVSRRG